MNWGLRSWFRVGLLPLHYRLRFTYVAPSFFTFWLDLRHERGKKKGSEEKKRKIKENSWDLFRFSSHRHFYLGIFTIPFCLFVPSSSLVSPFFSFLSSFFLYFFFSFPTSSSLGAAAAACSLHHYYCMQCRHRSNTELDTWINWLRRLQLLQSVPPSPGIQELLLLVHKLWQKFVKKPLLIWHLSKNLWNTKLKFGSKYIL